MNTQGRTTLLESRRGGACWWLSFSIDLLTDADVEAQERATDGLCVRKEMDKEQQRAAKVHLVACMQQGYSWQAAAATAGLQISQSNAYRLMKAFRQHGESALEDGRHGHPVKLRGEARTFLEEYCRQAPHTPSSTIQVALRERFDLSVSISQINRVRAALGVSNRPQNQQQGKKRK
jgi:putative transposase